MMAGNRTRIEQIFYPLIRLDLLNPPNPRSILLIFGHGSIAMVIGGVHLYKLNECCTCQ